MATGSDNDDDNTYAQREAFIRSTLESSKLIPVLEQAAQRRGFNDPASAVTYIISEMARDEDTYRAAVEGHYEPEQYSLLADIALSRLQEQIARRTGFVPG